jgi:glutaredoxin
MYYINIYVIKNCGYSEKALKLLKGIKHKIVNVDYDKKYIYKNDDINTFPQIYLKKNNSKGSLLIGGSDDLEFIINNIKKKIDIDSIYNILKKKYKNWSKKAILRLIELIAK